ncbi:MarR family winged helix-turn-helix transcriptional regulator [Floccifex sp.]|uniref:MarR family winged helix-turn-helix transcriptional regulator n=1 Tax=Floccifex sp. TaxID=2815810 RepID=UPI003F0CD23E
MNEHDINKELIIHFRNINHVMRSLFEGKGSQSQVLIVLLESGPMTQRKLTEILGIQPGSVSEVLSKLESSHFIERKISQLDRRTTDVTLTSQGLKQAQMASDIRKKRHENMFSCLNIQEKEILLGLLDQVTSDWEIRFKDKIKK